NRVGAAFVVVAAGVGVVVIVVVVAVLGGRGGGFFFLFFLGRSDFGGRGHLIHRIQITEQHFGELALLGADQCVVIKHLLHGTGVPGQGRHHLAGAFL